MRDTETSSGQDTTRNDGASRRSGVLKRGILKRVQEEYETALVPT